MKNEKDEPMEDGGNFWYQPDEPEPPATFAEIALLVICIGLLLYGAVRFFLFFNGGAL